MKILQWFCKIVISICFITLLWTFLFPTSIYKYTRERRFIFAPPKYRYLERKIDTEQIWIRAVPLVLIIGAGVIFLKWQSSKKSNDLKE